jgi:hypothetical protein
MVMNETRKAELFKAVKEAAIDNRLTCGKAHILAETKGYTLAEIGEVCEELKIKIKNCQLGCF